MTPRRSRLRAGAGDERRIVELFSELGFCGSDARIYLSLLRRNPATGYEIARTANVPRSAIYHALERLRDAGIIQQLDRRPVRYRPLPPERLLARLEADTRERLQELRQVLERQVLRPRDPLTIPLRGYSSLLGEAERLILSGQKSVFVSLWRREAQALAEPLARAAGRIEVVLFSFTRLPPSPARVLSYGIPEAELERHWPHKIVLVADRERALLGSAEPAEDNMALLTEEPVLVETAVSNLVLDLTLYGQRFGAEVGPLVESLTSQLAPIEDLARRADTLPD